jgi:2-succinyl-6-hydroxy-2,4-cyclohexadiene-1-carboxylate synthase
VSESLVLLHGFSGTHRAWDGVVECLDRERYSPLAIDLPGHGSAAGAEQPITFAGCAAHVLERSPDRFSLCGYSMGGRIALYLALAEPARVRRLVLVSSTPGIEDPEERAARRRSDHRLAEQLETGPFEDFIERWRTQPLFAGDPPEVTALARADQRRNRPEAMAAVLRGVGTGEMEPMWGRLGELAMEVTLVVGDRDKRFTELARRMILQLGDGRIEVISGGHALLLENPAEVARAIMECP